MLLYLGSIYPPRTIGGGGPPHSQALALIVLRLVDRVAFLERRLEQVEASVREQGGKDGPSMAESLARIANALDPPPPDVVGSPYVAGRLNCTTVWVAEMARKGIIPRHCVVPGTGNGKPWKFHRDRIDAWIRSR